MDQPTYEVAELTELLGRTFDELFPDDIWVIGEISNLTRSRAGHVYFDLVQPGSAPGHAPTARVSVILFDSTRAIVNKLLKRVGGIRMTDGMAVRVRGVVDFYPPQGRLQIRMTSIDPTYTLGAVALEREQLLERLRAGGHAARQPALATPLAPQKIGLVTSQGSAAEHDFLEELAGSGYAIVVHTLHTRVQGEGAHLGLVTAIEHFGRSEVDLIALIRGGGSRGDLAPYDSEELAMAIARCPVPVICGIGHEIDRSVADEVAHLSLKTPTACATMIVDRLRSLDRELANRARSIASHARQAMSTAASRLDHRAEAHRTNTHRAVTRADARLTETARLVQARAARSIVVADTRLRGRADRTRDRATAALRRASTRLDAPTRRIEPAARRVLGWARRELDGRETAIKASDPARLFARGWTITRTADGRVVREVASASVGDVIITRVVDGELRSLVERTEESRTDD